jgi:alpha-N-arabinofuranosidase
MFLRQQNSLRDGIAAALNFNIFARHADRVRMANIAQMVNVIQSMILTDGPKMVLTPTYYVHKMYLPFQGAKIIPVTLNAGTYTFGDVTIPQVDIIAARAADGQVWLALTNVDPNRSASVTANVSGIEAATATGEVLTAERVDSVNTFDNKASVVPAPYRASAQSGKLVLQLAPKSVTVVKLQ